MLARRSFLGLLLAIPAALMKQPEVTDGLALSKDAFEIVSEGLPYGKAITFTAEELKFPDFACFPVREAIFDGGYCIYLKHQDGSIEMLGSDIIDL